ncbi:MAG: PAS domain S-box protein [Gammaproteobacteria bacterium]|nr:PAS domain S-box protein [Gammaproteobacteria bacterium]
MAHEIRILLVEDAPIDALAVMAEVERGAIPASVVQVENRRQALDALDAGGWDLILTDFSLPDMTGMDLLGWVRERQLDLPVIVISGNVGELLAVQMMRAGAHDFITKGSLARLNPAIERELREQEGHRQRRMAEAALLESERNFRQLTEAIPEVFWLIDCERGEMLYLSPAFETVWEQPPALFMCQPLRLLETLHPEDYDRVNQRLGEQGWLGLNMEYRIMLPDGTVRWVNSRAFPVLDKDGKVIRIAGLSTDISDTMRLRQERETMIHALAQTADAVMITDVAGVIIYVNPAFEKLTGYQLGEVVGQTPAILKSGLQDESFYRALWANLSNGLPSTDIFINRRKSGELYYEAKTITPIYDAEGGVSHFVATGKDITDRLKTRERLHRIVNYDAITGLANRVLLQERLGQAILQCRRHARGFGLLCIGLNLKELLGEGYDNRLMEQLLRQVAQRLSGAVDLHDTVARMGGGEFMILHKDHDHAHEALEMLAGEIVAAFATPICFAGYELFLTPAIGISLFPDDAGEVELLLEHARVAMGHVHRCECGHYCFYQAAMLEQPKHLSS